MKLLFSSLVVLLGVYGAFCLEENDPGKKNGGHTHIKYKIEKSSKLAYYFGFKFSPYAEMLTVRCQVERNLKAIDAIVKKEAVPFDGCADAYKDYYFKGKYQQSPYVLVKETHYLLKALLHKVLIVLKKTGYNLLGYYKMQHHYKKLYKYHKKHFGGKKQQHYDETAETQEDPAFGGGYGYGGFNWYAVIKSLDYQIDHQLKIVTAVVTKQNEKFSKLFKQYDEMNDLEELEDPGYKSSSKKVIIKDDIYHKFVQVQQKLNQYLVVVLAEIVKRGGLYGYYY